MSEINVRKILLVDDNKAIHDDFRRVLQPNIGESPIKKYEAILFDNIEKNPTKNINQSYEIDSAYQGQEALEMVRKAKANKQSYFLAFVDIRMPPGWDGIETIKQLWKVDPKMQMVICSAYSEYSWEEITRQLGESDNLLILKKPFENIEIRQIASALTKKWNLIENLNALVEERTMELKKSLSITNATLESTADGILVIDKNKEILRYNQKFLKLWDIPEHLIKSAKSEIIFQRMANQLEDQAIFLNIMQKLTEKIEMVGTKDWKLKTDKVIEFFRQPQYLNNEVIGTVCSFRNITERKNLEEQLLYQATHDSLTELPNRLLLSDRISQAIIQAKRYKMSVGVLLLDLDNFKQINDSFGHKAGDLLLQMTAKRLLDCLYENDTVARLGGDEFVMILSAQCNEDVFAAQACKLLEAFSLPFEIENRQFTITASIGVSVYPKNGGDADTLLKHADIALYRAKENGRNTFQLYSSEFKVDILQRAELKSSMHNALERGEFTILYQPLIELDSNKIVGMEALLRWQHPTHGLLLPATFISLLDETGLIIPVGEWVLRTACLQAVNWHKEGFPKLHIAVNISPCQFRHKNFSEMVLKVIKETGIDPSTLELELTEGTLLTNSLEVIKKMKKLKELGINFAIDDFGIGYSNLSYIKFFPFSKIKIDKIFINDITSRSSDGYIVDAIINMSKNMGIQVLAEGVETEEQVDFLRQHRSTQVQGYYFGHPVDSNTCTRLLDTQRGLNLDKSK